MGTTDVSKSPDDEDPEGRSLQAPHCVSKSSLALVANLDPAFSLTDHELLVSHHTLCWSTLYRVLCTDRTRSTRKAERIPTRPEILFVFVLARNIIPHRPMTLLCAGGHQLLLPFLTPSFSPHTYVAFRGKKMCGLPLDHCHWTEPIDEGSVGVGKLQEAGARASSRSRRRCILCPRSSLLIL